MKGYPEFILSLIENRSSEPGEHGMTDYNNHSVVSFTVDKVVHNGNLKHLVGEHMNDIMAGIETAVARVLRNEWGISNNAINLTFSFRQVANEDISKMNAAALIANPELAASQEEPTQ